MDPAQVPAAGADRGGEVRRLAAVHVAESARLAEQVDGVAYPARANPAYGEVVGTVVVGHETPGEFLREVNPLGFPRVGSRRPSAVVQANLNGIDPFKIRDSRSDRRGEPTG